MRQNRTHNPWVGSQVFYHWPKSPCFIPPATGGQAFIIRDLVRQVYGRNLVPFPMANCVSYAQFRFKFLNVEFKKSWNPSRKYHFLEGYVLGACQIMGNFILLKSWYVENCIRHPVKMNFNIQIINIKFICAHCCVICPLTLSQSVTQGMGIVSRSAKKLSIMIA